MTKHPVPPLRCLVFLLLAVVAISVVTAAEPLTPAPKADDKKAAAYRITRGDIVTVSVFGEPDLVAGLKKVESRGTIVLPLIQEIRLAGLTLLEAQAAIEAAYRDQRYLVNPQVTVSIDTYARRIVSIIGKVKNPATYELPPDQKMTIKDLILRANGFDETAKGSDIHVTRILPDGSQKIYRLDLDNLLHGRSTGKKDDGNFELEPDDLVYVPEKLI